MLACSSAIPFTLSPYPASSVFYVMGVARRPSYSRAREPCLHTFAFIHAICLAYPRMHACAHARPRLCSSYHLVFLSCYSYDVDGLPGLWTGLSLVPCLRGFGGLNWTCQDSIGCARARVLVLSMPVFPIFIYFFALDCTLHCTDIERTLCARVPYPGPCSISILFRRSDHHIVFLATSHLRVFAVPPSPCIPFPSPRALPVLEESNIWQSLG
ncbi:hypothetical protein B0H13DRAFT_2048375 [Mycena leptocephala]|nr:hypothetical protein B0H13DRAFT_2048375 [Mycena leptocephala]